MSSSLYIKPCPKQNLNLVNAIVFLQIIRYEKKDRIDTPVIRPEYNMSMSLP